MFTHQDVSKAVATLQPCIVAINSKNSVALSVHASNLSTAIFCNNYHEVCNNITAKNYTNYSNMMWYLTVEFVIVTV